MIIVIICPKIAKNFEANTLYNASLYAPIVFAHIVRVCGFLVFIVRTRDFTKQTLAPR